MDDSSARLNEALAAWYAAVETGREPDRAALLGRYPELASFFAAKDDFEQDLGTLSLAPSGPTTAVQMPLLRGLLVAGHELLEEIGRGGMGVVYRALQVPLGRVVALKMIRGGELASDEDVQRFRAEAAVVASLDHPNIVPVYEVGEHDGRPFFSMKLIEGGNLARRLVEAPLPPRQAAAVLAAAARAVHHAHQRGVLHRDLKPANVLLDEHGTPYVSDFGLARRLAEPSAGPPLTAAHALVGTAAYMAPEQADGQSRQLTTAADVHGLGAILYECLTGRAPFQGESLLDTLRRVRDETPALPSAARPAIDRDLDTICRKCLEKDPSRRYESAAALADDLQRWLAGRPIEARPVGAAGRLWRWARRQPVLAGLTAGLLAVLVVVAIGASLAAVAMSNLAEDRRQAALAAGEAAGEAKKGRQEAEHERDAKGRALARAEGMRLTVLSSAARNDDPGLALLLAIEGERHSPGRLSGNALLAALNACREERTLRGDERPFRVARYTADGTRVLAAADDGSVRVWDAQGKQLAHHRRPWQNPFNTFGQLAFSPDGRRFAVVYQSSGNVRHFKPGAPSVATNVNYTPLVVRVGDVHTGRQTAVLRGHENRVDQVLFSPDGRFLLTGAQDNTARLWDAQTGQLLQVWRTGKTAPGGLAFSPDGKRVLTWSSGRSYSPYRRMTVSGPPGVDNRDVFDPEVVDDPEDPAVVARLGTPGSRGSHSGSGSGLTEAETLYAHVFDCATGKRLAVVRQSPLAEAYNVHRWPQCGVFSADGARFFLGQAGFTFGQVHDAATGAVQTRLRDGTYRAAVAAAFSPDGREVAALLTDGLSSRCVLLVAEVAGGEERFRLHGVDYPARLSYSPDGRFLLVAAGRTVRLFETESMREVAELKGHAQPIHAAAFSPDGRRVVTAGEDATVRLWRVDAPPGRHVLVVHAGQGIAGTDFNGPVSSVAFSPDGRLLATMSRESSVRLWDSRSGKKVAVLRGLAELPQRGQVRERALGEVQAVQFAHDGQLLVRRAAERTTLVEAPGEKPRLVPFCPVRLYDPAGKERAAYQADAHQVIDAAVSPDGRHVLTVEGGAAPTNDIDPFGAGQRASGGGPDTRPNVARLYDRATGKLLAVLREPDQRVVDNPGAPPGKEGARMIESNIVGAAFSPNGRLVATISAPRTSTLAQNKLNVWDVPTGKLQHTVLAGQSRMDRVLWAPDGKRLLLLVAGQGRLVNVDKPGQLVLDNEVRAVADVRSHFVSERIDFSQPLSPDGACFAGVGPNHTLVLLDTHTGKRIAVGKGHSRPLRQLAFSRDGRRIVTASEDGTARVWDAATGDELLTLTGHKGTVFDACFSPDGKRVATAGADGTLRVWELHLLPIALARTPRQLTAEERVRFEIPPSKKR